MYRVLGRLGSKGTAGSHLIMFLGLIALGFLLPSPAVAQGSSNDLGNGGRHAIQGRLYVSTGRRSQVSGLKIRLTSSSAGDLFVHTDETGTFLFRNLNGGSYTVTIEGGGIFEDSSENVVIDDPGSSSMRNPVRMRGAPRIVNVQVYLRPTAAARNSQAPGVINAKWASLPKEAVERFEQGRALVRDGKDREAEAEFRRALDISPSFAPAHTELGRIAQRAGNLNGSIAAWKDAIRYDPSEFDAHLNLGIAYLNLKKYQDAEAALVDAAFLNRTAVTPHYYLGIVFVIRNDLDVAQKAFETAKELKGGQGLPNIHKYLGRIYMKKEMGEKAIEELETYLKLSPNAQDAAQVKKDIADVRAKQIKNAFV